MKNAADMTALEIQGNRKWPAHLTTDEMRKQIAWEQHPDFEAATARLRAKWAAEKARR
jgi:hypothetical protein